MNRIICILISFAVIICLSITVYAHPGRTDSNGGHYNRTTGEYHYHHGQPAHQHYDMDGDGTIDCPYDFKNKSSSSSSSASLSSTSSSQAKQAESVPIIKEVPVTPDWVTPTIIIFFIVLAALIFSNWKKRKYISALESDIKGMQKKFELDLYHQTLKVQRDMMNMQAEKEKTDVEIAYLRKRCISLERYANTIKKDLEEEQSKRIEQYQMILNDSMCKKMKEDLGEDYIEKLSCAPPGTNVDENGKPHKFVDDHDIYIFYISPSGKYHRHTCQHSAGRKAINAIDIDSAYPRYSPCATCKPSLPDTTWVRKYLLYKALLSETNSQFE